jgi:hypothetical protein
MTDIFRHPLVLGRLACGEFEVIDCLKRSAADLRRSRLHIGALLGGEGHRPA